MTNVYIRQKPLLEKEKKIVKVPSDNTIIVTKHFKTYDGKVKRKQLKYSFNKVFNSKTDNQTIFDSVIKDNLIADFTCFMYGQTGSGKTYTVLGSDNNPGLFIKIANYLLDNYYEIKLSAYQIYNEEIKDLLNNNKTIKMYENEFKNFEIPDLISFEISDYDQILKSLSHISNNRTDGANNINFQSSRSHAIFIFKYINENNDEVEIRIIDLAGNERSKNSRILNFQSRQENKYINSSLFALKECIRGVDLSNYHIPYRRSKLTSVLRKCFRHDHNSIMIATVCSNLSNSSDIINTLEYACKLNKYLKAPSISEFYLPNKKTLPSIESSLDLNNSPIKNNNPTLPRVYHKPKIEIPKINSFNPEEREDDVLSPILTNRLKNLNTPKSNIIDFSATDRNLDIEYTKLLEIYRNLLVDENKINTDIINIIDSINDRNSKTNIDTLKNLDDKNHKIINILINHMKIIEKMRKI